MELIDRYVVAVGQRLPRKVRADVQRELRSILQDTLEEQAGDGSAEETVVKVLEDFGSPQEVAARYWPANQYLIGPALFPTFKSVTAIVLSVLAAMLILHFGLALLGDLSPEALGRRLLDLLTGIFHSSLYTFAVIVLVFSILQRLGVDGERSATHWSPLDLPDVEESDLVGRGEAMRGIFIPTAILILLNLFRSRIGFVVTPGKPVLLNEVFLAQLVWINLVIFAGMVIHLALLIQGRWHWSTRLLKIAYDLLGLWVLIRIAAGIVAETTTLRAAGLSDLLIRMIVRTFNWIVVVVAIIVVVATVKTVLRMVRRSYRSI